MIHSIHIQLKPQLTNYVSQISIVASSKNAEKIMEKIMSEYDDSFVKLEQALKDEDRDALEYFNHKLTLTKRDILSFTELLKRWHQYIEYKDYYFIHNTLEVIEIYAL